tara:strand:- start:330 stop:839 length:510 start_codon:yes stop_codon:yes gene_type:complete
MKQIITKPFLFFIFVLFLPSNLLAENNMIPLSQYLKEALAKPNFGQKDLIYVNYRCTALNQTLMRLMDNSAKDEFETLVKNNLMIFMNSGFDLYVNIAEDKISDDPWQDFFDNANKHINPMQESYLFQAQGDWQNTGDSLGPFLRKDFQACESYKDSIQNSNSRTDLDE